MHFLCVQFFVLFFLKHKILRSNKKVRDFLARKCWLFAMLCVFDQKVLGVLGWNQSTLKLARENWCFCFQFLAFFFLKHKILRPNKKEEEGFALRARIPGASIFRGKMVGNFLVKKYSLITRRGAIVLLKKHVFFCTFCKKVQKFALWLHMHFLGGYF